ncbi:MAG: hypothetical protein ACR2J6_04745 [Thermoleophilaceae bacterium]
MIEENSGKGADDTGDEAQAAQHDKGQDQQPKQAEEESSGLWDTKQHSDAPGPFGTGDTWDAADEENDEQE